jgi:protein-S-isoprenylcysteine O-methyltransferase Ste14
MAEPRIGFFDALQLAGLIVFLGTVVGKAVHLAREGINPITLDLRKEGLLGIAELLLFVAVNLLVGAVLLAALPLDAPAVPGALGVVVIDGLAVKVAGSVLITGGFVVFGLAMAALGDAWRLGLDDVTTGRLVTRGVYALSRNPIYVFFDLYFVGSFLVNGTLLFLLLAAFAVANLHYQILREEQFLSQVHGAAYDIYRAQTPRYLGKRRLAQSRVAREQRPLAEPTSGETPVIEEHR